MTKYSKPVWDQLKGVTLQQFQAALEKDGWVHRPTHSSRVNYYKDGVENPITLHPHPKKTFSPGLLKTLLDQTGWEVDDFKRLKLIKKNTR